MKSYDPVMGVSYNRNTCLLLDADLALLVVDASVSKRGVVQTRICSEMQGFSDPRLMWSAKLLRPALEMGRGVTQTRVERGITQTRV